MSRTPPAVWAALDAARRRLTAEAEAQADRDDDEGCELAEREEL